MEHREFVPLSLHPCFEFREQFLLGFTNIRATREVGLLMGIVSQVVEFQFRASMMKRNQPRCFGVRLGPFLPLLEVIPRGFSKQQIDMGRERKLGVRIVDQFVSFCSNRTTEIDVHFPIATVRAENPLAM